MKLLITGAWNPTEDDLSYLESVGYECLFHKDEREKLPSEFLDVDGIVCNGLFCYNDASSFGNLKFVQLTSSGLDRIPLDYFKQKGIKVFNAAGVYSIPIAEFVISSVLDLYKQKQTFFINQANHAWMKQRNLIELSGKKICIIGCGNVGRECAKKFKSFDCFVSGVDIKESDKLLFDRFFLIDDLDLAINDSDITILTMPLTSETRHMVNEGFLKKIKKTSILVNVSRGEIVDTKSLVDALQNKTIGGAVLDVFEKEPLEKESALWEMENVIISPHNSFVGDGNAQRLGKLIKSNLRNLV